jgi:hypothetical protein
MKAAIWIAVLAVALVWVSPVGAAASEAASCREEARAVSVEAQRVLRSDVNDAVGFNAVISDGLAARPECEDELQALYTWYESRAMGKDVAFPFPASEDPHDSWAGPIGWWWNQLYYGLFNSNAVLMWLFGWELFLGAILFAIGTGVALLTALFSFFSIPFRHRAAG